MLPWSIIKLWHFLKWKYNPSGIIMVPESAFSETETGGPCYYVGN